MTALIITTLLNLAVSQAPTITENGYQTSLLLTWTITEQGQLARQICEAELRADRMAAGITPADAPCWFVVKARRTDHDGADNTSLLEQIPCRQDVEQAWAMHGLKPGSWQVAVWLTHEGGGGVVGVEAELFLQEHEDTALALALKPVSNLLVYIDLTAVHTRLTALPELTISLSKEDGNLWEERAQTLPTTKHINIFERVEARTWTVRVSITCPQFTLEHTWEITLIPGETTILVMEVVPDNLGKINPNPTLALMPAPGNFFYGIFVV